MTTGMMQEQNLEKQIEKQMGCMAGFLQLFDRHHILSCKKFYTTKRLTSATVTDAASGSETSAAASPDVSRELAKPQTPKKPGPTPFQAAELRSPGPASAEVQPPKSPLPLPIFDLKQGTTKSTWKFKESPRLSLDSRATYDAAKGSLHRKEIRADRQILPANPSDDAGEESAPGDGDEKQRPRTSTSVIARLMGLETFSRPDPDPVKPAELRRSASESRVTRDLFHYRFVEANSSHSKQPNQSHCNTPNNVITNNVAPKSTNGTKSEMGKSMAKNKGGLVSSSSSSTWKMPQHRRSWFEAAEIFPETPKQTVSIYGEIEKRLKKMSGIDEAASKDLETLKQILEAWQLKGLLHSKKQHLEQTNHPNFVFDRSFPFDESPIVVMRPSRSHIHRMGDDSPSFSRGGVRRNPNLAGNSTPPSRDRNARSPLRGRSLSDTERSNSIVKPKPVSSVETQRRVNESTESRRAISSIHSPRVNQRRMGSDQTVTNRSPRNKKPTAEIYHKEKITTVITEDESSSISESTVSTSSQTDTERSKMEEYKEGRSLLERCDKLLHSIAEMNATDQQSSPVSVLDSSFYESASPSPIMKRSIEFKDHSSELEEEAWSRAILSSQSKLDDTSDDCDLIYISEILRASHYLPGDSDIFSLLEKQQYLKGKDTSKVSRLQRKLIFDTTTEILDRNRQLPPWKALSWTDSISRKPSLQKIWSEFQQIRERDNADDLVEIICGVLKKDLAGDAVNGWGECPVELSEVVLYIERMIFRDLVGETIRDLAAFAYQSTVLVAPRRKLVF